MSRTWTKGQLLLCCSCVAQVSAVQQELLQLREDAAAAGHERRQFLQQISTLQRQHAEQGGLVAGLQQQLAQVQDQLAQDRATLATMMRQHQEREQQLQEVGANQGSLIRGVLGVPPSWQPQLGGPPAQHRQV